MSAAESQIRDVLTRYCQGVDRKQYDLLRSCYHDDAFDSHGPYAGDADGFVAWVRNRHRNVLSSMHFLGNVSIRFSDDERRARTETYCLTYQHVAAGSDDPFSTEGSDGGSWLTIAARYVDTFELRPDTGWKILVRNVVYEWVRREDAAAYVPLDPAWTVSRRESSDLLFSPLGAFGGPAGDLALTNREEGTTWDS
jgi:hypothetical protein